MSCENGGRRGLRIRGVRQMNSQGDTAQPLRDRFETGMELKANLYRQLIPPVRQGKSTAVDR